MEVTLGPVMLIFSPALVMVCQLPYKVCRSWSSKVIKTLEDVVNDHETVPAGGATTALVASSVKVTTIEPEGRLFNVADHFAVASMVTLCVDGVWAVPLAVKVILSFRLGKPVPVKVMPLLLSVPWFGTSFPSSPFALVIVGGRGLGMMLFSSTGYGKFIGFGECVL